MKVTITYKGGDKEEVGAVKVMYYKDEFLIIQTYPQYDDDIEDSFVIGKNEIKEITIT